MIKSEIIKGQKSWILENSNIKLYLTEKGGHMAPVVFMKDSEKPVEPFYINPWAEEGLNLENEPAVLVPLRGDFFCLPFGGDNSWKSESHPVHGEVSGSVWTLVSEDAGSSIELEMNTTARKGTIKKRITIKDDENNIYISHDIYGFTGPASLGHHAVFPGGTMKYISTSPVDFGYTSKHDGSPYKNGEYCSLALLKKFDSLERVPSIWKDPEYTDCSMFPAREGFCDILQVYNKIQPDLAWSSVCVPEEGYLWFSLKDSNILPSTVLWMENRGRHQTPWDGRNCCIGVEDVCSSFADGLAVSAEKNFLNTQGVITSHLLEENTGLSVKYIQGVVRIPNGFDRVQAIVRKNDGVEITSFSGKMVFTKIDTGFIHS